MVVAGLVVLAVVASLFLIFSESVQLLRVGLVVALWAATLGALAMTKYRRESALEKAKVRDLQKVYELQLEREITARREYELGVEARVRGELGAEAETLAALRDELAALRRNLEVLFDGRLPEDRVALRAESTRVQELAGGYQPAASGLFVPGRPGPDPDREASPTPSGPGFATPYDAPVTAETTVIPPIEAEDVVESQDVVEDAVAVESELAVDVAPVDETEPELEIEPEAEAETELEDEFDEPRPGSRRSRRLAEDPDSGAHANGLSVAEIMANLESRQAADAGPRRRRRAE